MGILEIGVIISFIVCVVALILLVTRTKAFGKRAVYAKPAGSARDGIIYAFGQGMLPWAKESAREHLITYVTGLVYHASIFIALLYLVFILLAPEIANSLSTIFLIGVIPGLIGGIGLLVKRMLSATLRVISCPDDFVSNIVVDGFLALTVFQIINPSIRPLLLIWSFVLFLYIPLGKIKHCVFFFYMRILFGRFYGVRGVFPHRHVKDMDYGNR